MSKLQKKPSALKRGHPTLQNMNFYKFFPTFVGYFCPPGSGSTDPIESGSNPDPQPCREGTVSAAKICDLYKVPGVFPFKRIPVPFIRYFLSKGKPVTGTFYKVFPFKSYLCF